MALLRVLIAVAYNHGNAWKPKQKERKSKQTIRRTFPFKCLSGGQNIGRFSAKYAIFAVYLGLTL